MTRAYSMANHPAEAGIIMLNIRIALPPRAPANAPPGAVSSWLFSLRPGDEVDVRGPYGHFAVEPGERELVFIGGGAGMAPLRAQILDLLETQGSSRKISYWYGARSRRELYYDDDNYLSQHAAPETCEYFLCGPPLMVQAVLAMLDELGVAAENIHFDDFGS